MVHKKRCNIKICTFFTPAIKPLLYYYTSQSHILLVVCILFWFQNWNQHFYTFQFVGNGKKMEIHFVIIYIHLSFLFKFIYFAHCAVEKLGWGDSTTLSNLGIFWALKLAATFTYFSFAIIITEAFLTLGLVLISSRAKAKISIANFSILKKMEL